MAKLFLTLAIFCIFVVILVNGLDKDAAVTEFMKKADACRAEVGAQESDIKDLVEKKPGATMESKCLRACLMKVYGAMDGNGKLLNNEALKNIVSIVFVAESVADKMKAADEVINTCAANSVSADHCEAADEYVKCFKDQGAAH